jgi:hypothetical protein
MSPGQGPFCVEPISHGSNALEKGRRMNVLGPGATTLPTMTTGTGTARGRCRTSFTRLRPLPRRYRPAFAASESGLGHVAGVHRQRLQLTFGCFAIFSQQRSLTFVCCLMSGISPVPESDPSGREKGLPHPSATAPRHGQRPECSSPGDQLAVFSRESPERTEPNSLLNHETSDHLLSLVEHEHARLDVDTICGGSRRRTRLVIA